MSDLQSDLRRAYRQLDDALFERCLRRLPGIPTEAFCYFQDGDKQCCVFGNFINLQQSPAGFGDTWDEAQRDLVRQFVCATCEGEGVVKDANKVTVDKGSRYQRTDEELVTVQCPTCNGSGMYFGDDGSLRHVVRRPTTTVLLDALRCIAAGCAFPEDDVQRAIRDRARDAIARAESDTGA